MANTLENPNIVLRPIIGKVYRVKDKIVVILNGKFYKDQGGIDNKWVWQEVNWDGSLGKVRYGLNIGQFERIDSPVSVKLDSACN